MPLTISLTDAEAEDYKLLAYRMNILYRASLELYPKSDRGEKFTLAALAALQIVNETIMDLGQANQILCDPGNYPKRAIEV